ncbi:MAG: LLM class flavin-dependent oxidoreductase [Ktedonobacteraceae bacterium]|nr:LLM class flavin-dependent oxidoreductase [Chloroflexota bacterium]
MKIGIGLPANIPGVRRELILDWARRAEAGPFSSLALVDRVVYPNFEPLITFAAVAAVTERVRLVTSVLLAPLRDATLLAKQSASLDALSNGRLTLGLGVGSREDDFRATATSLHDRGKRFDLQLAQMTRIWAGQALSEQVGPIGPAPVRAGGPEILLGAYSPAGIQRLGRWGDGYIAGGGGDSERARQLFNMAGKVWQEAGRAGKPRLVACMYYGLGPNASEGIHTTILNYYSFMGPMAQQMANNIPATPEAVSKAIASFTDIGVDELILWPCIPDLDQVSRLEDLVGR